MNQKNIKFVLIFIIILILGVSLYYFSKPLDTRLLEVNFIVGGISGIGVGSNDSLNYGIVMPGNSVTKKVKIGNNFDFPVEVTFLATKNIQPFIFSDSKVLIPPGESKLISFTLELPKNMSYGDYSGEIKLDFRKE